MVDVGIILMYIAAFFGLFTGIYFLLTLLENKDLLKSPEAKRYPSVTIIVPAYNEEQTIEKDLDSLLTLDYPKEKLSIIVVDDGSKDRTYELAKAYEQKGVAVYTKKNEGKG